jgi:hypothetical protein
VGVVLALALFVLGTNYCVVSAVTVRSAPACHAASHCGHAMPAKRSAQPPCHSTANPPCCVELAPAKGPVVEKAMSVSSALLTSAASTLTDVPRASDHPTSWWRTPSEAPPAAEAARAPAPPRAPPLA